MATFLKRSTIHPDALMWDLFHHQRVAVIYFIITATLWGLIVATLTEEESAGLVRGLTDGKVEWMLIWMWGNLTLKPALPNPSHHSLEIPGRRPVDALRRVHLSQAHLRAGSAQQCQTKCLLGKLWKTPKMTYHKVIEKAWIGHMFQSSSLNRSSPSCHTERSFKRCV